MSLYGVAEPIKLNRIIHELLLSYQAPLGSFAVRKMDMFFKSIDFQNKGTIEKEYFINGITSLAKGGIGTADANILINCYRDASG